MLEEFSKQTKESLKYTIEKTLKDFGCNIIKHEDRAISAVCNNKLVYVDYMFDYPLGWKIKINVDML